MVVSQRRWKAIFDLGRSGVSVAAHRKVVNTRAQALLSATWRAGLAGYVYYQLTGDSGSGNKLRTVQIQGCIDRPEGELHSFTIAGKEWSANLRGYYEFWAQNRLEGYAVIVTLSIPLGNVKK
jgi:hypothetical protein